MIARIWSTISNRSEKPEASRMRRKLFFNERPDILYAIGDVHGCHDLFKRLHARIMLDAAQHEGVKVIIMLGDYVDRGPNSASVIDDLLARDPVGIERHCLAGNHEETMLDFLHMPRPKHPWLGFGGLQTLQSYGVYDLPRNRQKLKTIVDSHIPGDHLSFLQSLPSLVSFPGICFVHAGVENGVPLQHQNDKHLLWSRPHEQKVSATPNAFLTVHGHTPVKNVALVENRLNVDTGAFMTGRLSAVKISRSGDISVMHAD